MNKFIIEVEILPLSQTDNDKKKWNCRTSFSIIGTMSLIKRIRLETKFYVVTSSNIFDRRLISLIVGFIGLGV